MDKERLYDLAFAFRDNKVWKQIFEEELFAVRLSSGNNSAVGYCSVMGRNGEHCALAVYVGAEGFSSLRKLFSISEKDPAGVLDYLTQDCIQCSLEQRDQFSPEELKEIRSYCKKTGRQFRAPLPQFSRYYPYCMPWYVTDEDDWKAIETALLVVKRITENLGNSGKAAIGLHPILMDLDDETYAPEQMLLFDDPVIDDDITIPLYSIENDELVIERIPLPPYTERRPAPPAHIDDAAVEKLKHKKQNGIYECEIIRLPEPVHGEPPYIPAALIAVNDEGFMLQPTLGNGPAYDPDELLAHFIKNLGKAYPKAIKVRTEETKLLLEEFCRKANILLAISDHLECLDEAIDSLFGHMLGDDDEEYDDDDEYDTEDDLNDMIAMLDEMSLSQIRMLPGFILDQILDAAEFFPEDIVKKVCLAKGK